MSEIYIENLLKSVEIGALALGNFDGVHLGHRELISESVRISEALGLKAGVLTFTPHPREFFEDQSYSKIYELRQNVQLLKSLGVSQVFLKNFDKECSELSASEFLDLILTKVKFKFLVVGFDFKLGKDRSGNHELLSKWCLENSIKLKVVGCKKGSEGLKISSTLIKDKLNQGLIIEARELLGAEYFHSGDVVQDQGLGKKIGFPTVNLKLDHKISILYGVYLTSCLIGETKYKGISNIGFRPTVSSSVNKMVLETHILDSDFPNVKSGDSLKIIFEEFIRPEQKFANIDELKNQIEADVSFAQSRKN